MLPKQLRCDKIMYNRQEEIFSFSNREVVIMRLADFDEGTEITICSQKEHSHYEYDTKIIRTKRSEGIVIAEVILSKDKEVRYMKPGHRAYCYGKCRV